MKVLEIGYILIVYLEGTNKYLSLRQKQHAGLAAAAVFDSHAEVHKQLHTAPQSRGVQHGLVQ